MISINGKMLGSRPKGRPRKYDFAAMAIGDYFDAPRDLGVTKRKSDKRQHAISNSARKFTKDNPQHLFEIRCIDKETVRCTRIK